MAEQDWHREIFHSQTVTNLAVPASGNKYIAESVISHIVENPGVDYVLVNWSGLVRVDIPLPLRARPPYDDKFAVDRTTETSRYWANDMAPWRDKNTKIKIEERLTRIMYQEKGYASVKNQALLSVVNLQNFLKVRKIPYLFSFLYDYTNTDFDHNHLTAESKMVHWSTLGTVPDSHPLLAEIDRANCLEPAGIDWALTQPQDLFEDPLHLTDHGLRAWAREMLKYYQTQLTGSKGVL
jgi:hypothetical protein